VVIEQCSAAEIDLVIFAALVREQGDVRAGEHPGVDQPLACQSAQAISLRLRQ
jgi:hypothetical protein